MLEHKSFEVKVGELGEVEAIFSTFDVVDRDGDVVTRQALAPYDGEFVRMVDSHQWGVTNWLGDGRISVGTKFARFHGHFYLDTPQGDAAYRTLKHSSEKTQWSWSFAVKDSDFESRDGKSVRVIKTLAESPFEVSPVLVGAGMGTQTVSIKGLIAEDETRLREIIREELKELIEKAEWDTAYINNLPDSAFAAIEPGGEKDDEGKTVPRSKRHYPHHDNSGAVDVRHLQNARARVSNPNNYQGGKGHLFNEHKLPSDSEKAAKPMPVPMADESHDDFIERCMSDEMMRSEFADDAQRMAVCQAQAEKQADITPEKGAVINPELSDIERELLAASAQRVQELLEVNSGVGEVSQ